MGIKAFKERMDSLGFAVQAYYGSSGSTFRKKHLAELTIWKKEKAPIVYNDLDLIWDVATDCGLTGIRFVGACEERILSIIVDAPYA